METIRNMFREQNPHNLRKYVECLACSSIWILIAGAIVALHYTGTYLLFGFIIAGSPNYDRVTGCPLGKSDCNWGEKMTCYEETMAVCHLFGVVTLGGVILGMFITVMIIIGVCYGVYKIVHDVIASYAAATTMSENNYNIVSDESMNVELDIVLSELTNAESNN